MSFTPQPRGISLLEVIIASMILMTAATALVVATTSMMHKTRLSDELRAANFAARQRMEEMLQVGDIFALKKQVAASDTFPVYLNRDLSQNSVGGIELQGIGGVNAAEIVLVEREDIAPTDLGRDMTSNTELALSKPDGKPDGVFFCPLPMDFNGNGTADDIGTIVANKLLIGVVVRWITANGREERYELWSVK
jgi:type II secretory pathway pseudopilin PulG